MRTGELQKKAANKGLFDSIPTICSNIFRPFPLKQARNPTRRLSVSLACSLAFHYVLLFTANYLEQGVTTTSLAPLPHLSVHLQNSAPVSSYTPARGIPLPVTKTDRPKASPSISNETDDTGGPSTSQEKAPTKIFSPYDVDEIAFALTVPELPLPTNKETMSGSLQIKVFIDTSGIPDEIEIVLNTLPDDYAASLTNAFSKAKFQPALRGGVPVNSWRVIEITYGDKEPPSPLDEGAQRESQ